MALRTVLANLGELAQARDFLGAERRVDAGAAKRRDTWKVPISPRRQMVFLQRLCGGLGSAVNNKQQ